VTEWEVLLADGTTRDSSKHTWDDVPDGVLVVWYWGPRGQGVNWGDGLYGHPETLRQAGYVSDEAWAAAEATLGVLRLPPSER
jgi:hypothetical protein